MTVLQKLSTVRRCLAVLVLLLIASSSVLSAPWGNALRFDGTQTCAIVPKMDGAPSGNAPYTVEFWLRMIDYDVRYYNGVQWYNGIIVGRGSEGPGRLQFVCLIDGHIGLTHWGSDSDTAVSVEAYRWHHVATTWNGSVECLYVDGVLRWSRTGAPLNVDGAGSLTIGKHDNYDDYYFSGEVDELRIWNYVRTGQQIAGDYNVQVDPGAAGLVAYWKFDEAEGQTIIDSAHGNNGYLGRSLEVEAADARRVSVDVPVLLGASGRSIRDMPPPACHHFRYCVWGSVGNVEPVSSPTWFELQDGSGYTIRVTDRRGFTGIGPGDYVAVSGRLDASSTPILLHTRKEQVSRIL